MKLISVLRIRLDGTAPSSSRAPAGCLDWLNGSILPSPS
ncbi:hypothetical protein SS05631_c00420 [Sinorhizobium sp. CCBAU 05631]|nr:hypothetical protein SS05631_c00420 [Sinorhizobium sp. CCBAU 05631]